MSTGCPCGRQAVYDECCGPFIEGKALPDTAEQLMRSRYSAYVVGAADYIIDTHDPRTREMDRAEVERWSEKSEWLGLEIVSTEDGGPEDEHGIVEFRARFFDRDTRVHHERSSFRREEGRWLYVNGTPPDPDPRPRRTEKVGRNEPCPCGSGKKYKKCCGRAGR
jgi:SEC-C motif-containing protein